MRRFFALVLLGFCALPAAGRDQDPAASPKKRIFAVGGWRTPKEALPLMRFFIGLTGKPNPKVCLLPTASGDSAESIVAYYDVMNQLDCRPRHLRLFQPSRVDDFEAVLMDMDAIYVGGGNTLNMLAIWKAQGIDRVLEKALNKGIVLGGASAGMICWFEQGCSDFKPGKLSPLDGLGWLPGSACPHYDLEKRRAAYADLVLAGELKDGIACEEGVGALYEDGKRSRVVSSLPKARAHSLRRVDGRIESSPLEPEILGN
jgi:dipeptidase E